MKLKLILVLSVSLLACLAHEFEHPRAPRDARGQEPDGSMTGPRSRSNDLGNPASDNIITETVPPPYDNKSWTQEPQAPKAVCFEMVEELQFEMPPKNLTDLKTMNTKCVDDFPKFKSCVTEHTGNGTNPNYRFKDFDQQCLDFKHLIRSLNWSCMMNMIDWQTNYSNRCQTNLTKNSCESDNCMLNSLAYDVHNNCAEEEFRFFYENIFRKNEVKRKLFRERFETCEAVVTFKWPGYKVSLIDSKENDTITNQTCPSPHSSAPTGISLAVATTVSILFVFIWA